MFYRGPLLYIVIGVVELQCVRTNKILAVHSVSLWLFLSDNYRVSDQGTYYWVWTYEVGHHDLCVLTVMIFRR